MDISAKAKLNLKEGLKDLDDLETGRALHYCIVRVGGGDDEVVRAIFGSNASAATKEVFARVWAEDDAVTGSMRPKWYIARGAIVNRGDKLVTYPALRGNRAIAAADVKGEFKALRKVLNDSGMIVTALKRVVDGKFERPTDTSKLDVGVLPDGEDADDDENDAATSTEVKNDETKALIARYRKCGLNKALTALRGAGDDRTRKAAEKGLGNVRDDLAEIHTLAETLEAGLKRRKLGSTRYKDSLRALVELQDRCASAVATIERALGATIGGADLTGRGPGKEDTILASLRALVQKFNSAPDAQKLRYLTDAYFTADQWLKAAGVGTKRGASDEVDGAMRSKVEHLFDRAARELAKRAGVGINKLPQWLEENHGKGLTEHGLEVDMVHKSAEWLDVNQREVFRVHVKGGKLYQYPWWDWTDEERNDGAFDLSKKKLVPVDSSKGSSPTIKAGYSGFVLSMGGDLFMMRQVAGTTGKENGRFHSSYMAGMPIMMAGEILVKAGAVQRINTGSGHYQPPAAMMVRMIKLLGNAGVKIDEVADFQDKNVQTVEEFLRTSGDAQLDGAANAAHEKEMAKFRQRIFLKEVFARDAERIKVVRDHAEGLTKLSGELTAAILGLESATAKQLKRATDADRKARAEYKLALRHVVNDQREVVPKLIADLREKIAKREEANAALRGKSGGPVGPSQDDAYVAGLRALREDAEKLDAELARAKSTAETAHPTVKV